MEPLSQPEAPLHPARRPVLYPDRYAWYVLASSIDIMMTVTVLVHLGFGEVNTFARWSIDRFGTWGLIGLKFASVIVVVFICEFVGRRHPRLGGRIATLAIALSLFPVLAAIVQILFLLMGGSFEGWEKSPHG
jgi:uncharacterized membrane protein